MARIDHDQRPAVIAALRDLALRRLGLRRAARARFEREIAHEARAIDRDEIEHQPRGLTVDRLEHEGLVDAHRAGRVDHDARAALHHEAVAERLDQPAPLLAGARGKLERHLRQIDDDAIWVGQRKGRDLDGAGQIEHEPRAAGVAAEPRIACDRKCLGRCRGPRKRRALLRTGRQQAGKQRSDKQCRPQRHDLSAFTHTTLTAGLVNPILRCQRGRNEARGFACHSPSLPYVSAADGCESGFAAFGHPATASPRSLKGTDTVARGQFA